MLYTPHVLSVTVASLTLSLPNQVDLVTPEPIPPPPDGVTPVMHRTDGGHYNELDAPAAGAAQIPLGRNCPGYAPGTRREMIPDPFLVSQKLLARRPSGPNGDYFKPAGAQLNILAAAWIQAMVVSEGCTCVAVSNVMAPSCGCATWCIDCCLGAILR